jgi:hypothetical protein
VAYLPPDLVALLKEAKKTNRSGVSRLRVGLSAGR